MASIRKILPAQVWTQVASGGDGKVYQTQGTTRVVYVVSAAVPTTFDTEVPVTWETERHGSFEFVGLSASESIYAYAINGAAEIAVSTGNGLSFNLDADYFNGLGALNVQSYTESNIKLGKQFGISVELVIPSGVAKYLSLKTPAGADSIIVKSRIINTDGGMRYTPRTGAVYNETGTPVPIRNFNGQSSNLSAVAVLELDNVPSNIGTAFDVIRSKSGQGGQGEQGVFSGDGLERILAKDTAYLLQFENLDQSDIYIIYSIAWFEGVPDLPRL